MGSKAPTPPPDDSKRPASPPPPPPPSASDRPNEMQRLIDGHASRSHYERTHWVHCMESTEDVLSVIYDPNGNAMTHGELVALINELQDENEELQSYKQAMG